MFLTRAHAQGWETETLSYREAQALSQQRRAAGKAIDNRFMLAEVRDRDDTVKKLQKQKQRHAAVRQSSRAAESVATSQTAQTNPLATPVAAAPSQPIAAAAVATVKPQKPVPYVRVYDYEDLKREAGLL